MSSIAVNAITDASAGNTTTINSVTPNVNNVVGKNRIINGNMAIDQRNLGAAVTVTSSTTDYYLDRFISANTTGTGTITAQQSTLGNSKSFKLTATAAVTDLSAGLRVQGIQQRIEAQNIFDLNNTTITVSFKVETNWTGNLAVALRSSGTLRSYIIDAPVVSGTNNISISILLQSDTVSANDSSIGVELNIGANNEGDRRTATTGSWVTGNYFLSTSSTQWTKTLNNFINITGVQLEAGSSATEFEHRQYGTELQLCQRYYQKNIFAPIAGYSPTTSRADGTVVFPVVMRTTPTALEQSGTASDYGVFYRGQGTACNSVPTYATSTAYGGYVRFNCPAVFVVGEGTLMAPYAVGAYLAWSAEL